MSREESLFPLAAAVLTGVFLVATVFLTSDFALAEESLAGASPPSCACPESEKKSAKPKFAGLNTELDQNDRDAALENLQLALSKVGDGASYVWHRSNGRLSGLVQPTSSFRNDKGAVCRHLVLLLTTGEKTRKTEGIACRLANGLWRLDG